MGQNLKVFLSLIAYSEDTLGHGDDGYNVIVGHELFHDYSDHPRKKVWIKRINDYSSAAGRYQIIARIFDAYKTRLGLKDFGKEAQDKIAIRLIGECKAMKDIENGNIKSAIIKCKSRWASFPGAGYGQKEHKIGALLKAYDGYLKEFKQV